MTYAKKTLSEIKLIHGDFGNFIKGQKLDKQTSSMSIDNEPKAQVTVGKFDDF